MTIPAAAPSTSTAPHQLNVVAADVNKIVTAVDQLSTVLTTRMTSTTLNQRPAAPAVEVQETQSKTTEFLMKWDAHQFNMH